MPSPKLLRAFPAPSLLLLAAAGCALEPAEAGEASQVAGELVAKDDAGAAPITPTANDTFHNWFTGTRGNEHGTGAVSHGDCPPGAVVVGVQYFEGGNSDWADNLGVACWGPSAGYRFFNWLSPNATTRGPEQGTHGSGLGLCPWGMFVSGLQYFGGGSLGDGVDGIGVRCSNESFTATAMHNWFPDQPNTEQGDFNPHFNGCPNNTVVVGVQAFEGIGGQPDWMDAIGVHCATRPW